MSIFNKSLKINISLIILIIFISLIILFSILFSNSDEPKLMSLFGSLVAGLFVAIIQFIIALQDYLQVEKLKELKLIKVMYDRYDRNFYSEYITRAKRRILIMGVTASRFFSDFADCDPKAIIKSKILLQKLLEDVEVKILLPNMSYLNNENKKNDFNKVKEIIDNIRKQIPQCKIEVKYFEHLPSHSIFIVDDSCIVGPIFPNLESKNTPSLQLHNSSPMAIQYLKYFDEEWENSNV